MAQFSHSATNWHSLCENHRFPNDGVNVWTPIEGIAHFPEWEQFVKKKKKVYRNRLYSLKQVFTADVCSCLCLSLRIISARVCAHARMCERVHACACAGVCLRRWGWAAKCVCMWSIQTVNTLMLLKRREEVQQTAPLVKVSWLTFAAAFCGTLWNRSAAAAAAGAAVAAAAHDSTFRQSISTSTSKPNQSNWAS